MTRRALIGCEFSGVVREAFAAQGWDAWSCDILPTEHPGQHLQCDVRDVLNDGWDIAVFHPPCTYLCNSGVRWLHTDPDRWELLIEAAAFFRELLNAPIPAIAIENPVMHRYARRLVGMNHTQTFQPWQFGHGECKRTCLWLKNLPALKPTDVVEGREQRIWKMPPSADRAQERSRTFTGIASAMAVQFTAALEHTS